MFPLAPLADCYQQPFAVHLRQEGDLTDGHPIEARHGNPLHGSGDRVQSRSRRAKLSAGRRDIDVGLIEALRVDERQRVTSEYSVR